MWALLLALTTRVVICEDKKGGDWNCNAEDGFWYENGEKTKYSCGKDNKKKNNAEICTTSEDKNMPEEYPKTCIDGPPDNGLRCWWTHVPAAIKSSTAKVPLVVEMHGGGGCASHAERSSGFKGLSDSLGKDGFVIVWPQGHNLMWGTCGSDCADMQLAMKKDLHQTDDVTFLSKMVEHIVAGSFVDAERVYFSGFSMGCMMSHRMALEKSELVAGFGCHGGTLIVLDSDFSAEKPERFALQPMPVYMTGGTEDVWFTMASRARDAWGAWNGCAKETTTDVTVVGNTEAASSPTTATMITKSDCSASSAAVEVVTLNLTDGKHVNDPRMAKYIWDFLKEYKRAGALAALQGPKDPTSGAGGQDYGSGGVSQDDEIGTVSSGALRRSWFPLGLLAIWLLC
jgi:poly(3-hydroxybutyrate) depolymerase